MPQTGTANCGLCDFEARRIQTHRRNMFTSQNLRMTSRKLRDLASGLKRVRFAQLNKGNQTQFDPSVIAIGRRLKTSACLRFYAVFTGVCTRLPSLKLSLVRCLYQPRRESAWVLFLPLASRLSGASKSRDPGMSVEGGYRKFSNFKTRTKTGKPK